MLSEWEMQQLVEIERDLSSDHELAHQLAKLSPQRGSWSGAWRRFYPAGYLLSAVTYMLMSMAGSAARGLGGLMIAVLTVWVGEQVRQTRRQRAARGSSAVIAADG